MALVETLRNGFSQLASSDVFLKYDRNSGHMSPLQSVAMRRALGAAAAFEKYMKDRGAMSVLKRLQGLPPYASTFSLPPDTAGPIQSCIVEPIVSMSSTGRTECWSVKTGVQSSWQPKFHLTGAAWPMAFLKQHKSPNGGQVRGLGNGAAGVSKANETFNGNGGILGVEEDEYALNGSHTDRHGHNNAGDAEKRYFGARNSGPFHQRVINQQQGYATEAVGAVDLTISVRTEPQQDAAKPAYDTLAQARAMQALAKKEQPLKQPPPRPSPPGGKSSRISVATTQRKLPPVKPSTKHTATGGDLHNPSMVQILNDENLDRSTMTGETTSVGTPSDDQIMPNKTSVANAETTAGSVSSQAPKKAGDRSIPPLVSAVGKPLKPKGRSATRPTVSVGKAPDPSFVVDNGASSENPVLNGAANIKPAPSASAPGVPPQMQPVEPMSKKFAGGVGKEPDTVRGAPLRDLLEEKGIVLPDYGVGEHRILCAKCKGGESKELSLSVTIKTSDEAVWNCFRGKCGWRGAVKSRYPTRGSSQFGGSYAPSTKTRESALQKKRFPTKLPRPEEFLELGEEETAFFKNRKISEGTLARNGVKRQHAYCPQLQEESVALVFPYMRRGELVNIKYRGPQKMFWQVKGAEKVFYGLDDVADSKTIIIVEGEMDKLAMEEAGYLNCVSVPDGAPPKAAAPGTPLPAPEEDRKYEYLWNCREYLDKASKFVLATDADEPGQALAEELARRLGREKCWRVTWPTIAGGQQVKDANEALMRVGKSGVREALEGAEAFPIRGLFKFESFFSEIDDYYNLQLGDERGVSTGWAGLDDLYRIVPGELSVVTGVPNSGKSEWLDALLCNLVAQRGWNFALCSMENKVRDHARKLIEKFVGAPFFDAPYGEQQPRVSVEQLELGKRWINDHFHVIRCEDDELPSIEWVLGLARAAVLRHGIRGLVIDPYNELDHQRPSRQTETEYVSQMLTKIKRFAQHHDCHVWFVAHPKQLQQWKGEAPGLYDISGSAHFVNKTDNGVVVHRNRDPETGPLDEVKILVRKVRNKAAGTIGEASLRYDRVTGRYDDVFL